LYEPQARFCSTFLPTRPYRQKLLLGSNSVVIGFQTFTFGASVPVTSPLSFQ